MYLDSRYITKWMNQKKVKATYNLERKEYISKLKKNTQTIKKETVQPSKYIDSKMVNLRLTYTIIGK